MTYDITVSSADSLHKRSYISITINGKRYKEYNGNTLNLNINPNRAKSLREKSRLLKLLEFEYRKALESGAYQQLKSDFKVEISSTRDALKLALNQKKQSNLTAKYVKSLTQTLHEFLVFLSEKEKSDDASLLSKNRIQEFLNGYKSTPTYYMSKRKELRSLFGYLRNNQYIKDNPISGTEKLKLKATLHKIYSRKQLHEVLAYLKQNHENLYLCCLISYGCFLRPHIEVRNLKGSHFKSGCTEIHLSGDENKSGRIRTVYIPDYVRSDIISRASKLASDDNLFSLDKQPYNEYYFKTAWSRHFKIMLNLGLVEENQTIYSFRHTAAVNVYKKTKDLHLLQQLLGHSNMIVTLKYLRGLGVHNMDELKEVMPVL